MLTSLYTLYIPKLDFHWFPLNSFPVLNLALLSSAWQNVKACLLFHKCPARSHTGWLNVLSRLVQFPLTHCSWLPLPEKAIGSSTQLFGIVSACRERKGNKCCFMHIWPERGSTYCQENFLTARDEFKKDQSFHCLDVRGRLTAATKTVFLTQRRERSKTWGERTSRLPCRELYLSERMIRLCRTSSSE